MVIFSLDISERLHCYLFGSPLENCQRVYYTAENVLQDDRPPSTILTSFLETCQNDDFAKRLLQSEMLRYYVESIVHWSNTNDLLWIVIYSHVIYISTLLVLIPLILFNFISRFVCLSVWLARIFFWFAALRVLQPKLVRQIGGFWSKKLTK